MDPIRILCQVGATIHLQPFAISVSPTLIHPATLAALSQYRVRRPSLPQLTTLNFCISIPSQQIPYIPLFISDALLYMQVHIWRGDQLADAVDVICTTNSLRSLKVRVPTGSISFGVTSRLLHHHMNLRHFLLSAISSLELIKHMSRLETTDVVLSLEMTDPTWTMARSHQERFI